MSDSERTTTKPPPGTVARRTRGAQVVPLRPGYGVPAPTKRAPSNGDGGGNGNGNGNGNRGGGGSGGDDEDPKPKVRIRKLRVLALLIGLGLLAIVSTVFGMMMAVASDLPKLEEPATVNSIIVDDKGRPLGKLQGNERRVYLDEARIAPVMKHAIIAIEDQRFYTNEGVDLRGIARAVYAGRAPQGRRPGRVDDHAAVRQERARRPEPPHGLREAARGGDGLPPHAQVVQGADPARLPQHDLLRQRRVRDRGGRAHLLRVQSPGLRHRGRAARAPVRRAADAGRGGDARGHRPEPERLRPDPAPRRRAHPPRHGAAEDVRAGLPRRASSTTPRARSRCPTRGTIAPPQEETKYPYFTSWIKQQVVDQLGGGQEGARVAFEGGLRVKTTIDVDHAGRRAARDRPVAAQPGRPARGARRDRQPHRRGPGDGRRRRLQHLAVQPRHAGPAPAGLVDQAVHPRPRATRTASRRPPRGRRTSS